MFTCSKCLLVKPQFSFPYAKGVRHCWCRECCNEDKRRRRKAYREQNPRKKRLTHEKFTLSGMFVCSKCKQECNPHEANGSWCRSCRAKCEAERRLRNGIVPKNKSAIVDNCKQCTDCGVVKEFDLFFKAKRGRAGLQAYCKECSKNRKPCRQAANAYAKKSRGKPESRAKHRLRQFKRKQLIEAKADGTMTAGSIRRIYECSECAYCQEIVPESERTIDHVIPLIKGGVHSIRNAVMACRSCNSVKSDSFLPEFLERLKCSK